MIQLSLSQFLETYLFALLAVVFILWTVGHWKRRRRERALRKTRLRCRVCAHHFTDESNNPLPECPHCGRLNQRKAVLQV
ncbi:MAG: hypothetical protein AAF514_12575 [Verrucomicrobiota bacterium]